VARDVGDLTAMLGEHVASGRSPGSGDAAKMLGAADEPCGTSSR
jgi:hypothetical protein